MSEPEQERPWEHDESAKAHTEEVKAGARKENRAVALGCGGFLVVAALIAAWAYVASSGEPEPDEFDLYEQTFSAEAACEDFVSDRLRAPSTAEFTGTNASIDSIELRTFTVTGAVDAENAFGAAIRANFTCELRLNAAGDTWSLTSLTGLD